MKADARLSENGSPQAESLFSFLEVIEVNDQERFGAEFATMGARLLQKQNRREIERAIDRAKMTEFDRWFRRQFYRAAARRRSGAAARAEGHEDDRTVTQRAAARMERPGRYEYTSGE